MMESLKLKMTEVPDGRDAVPDNPKVHRDTEDCDCNDCRLERFVIWQAHSWVIEPEKPQEEEPKND